MSKDIVECVHWDPEVDPVVQATRKKNNWVWLACGLAVLAVAVGVSLWLFLPHREPLPTDPTTESGQTTDPSIVTGVQPQPTQPPLEDPTLTQGIALYNAGSYGQALDVLNQAVIIQPDSGAAYTYRGLTQFSLANYLSAIQDFTQSMKRMGESAELRTLRGTSYYMQGLYPEAIGDLTRAIELDPNSRNAYTYRAMAYEATGRVDLATADRAKIGG